MAKRRSRPASPRATVSPGTAARKIAARVGSTRSANPSPSPAPVPSMPRVRPPAMPPTREPDPSPVADVVTGTNAAGPDAADADAVVARLTQQLLRLLETSGRDDVVAKAEMGRVLQTVRERLPHGAWQGWLQRRVPFTKRTAARAIGLHKLSREAPDLFARVAPLGVAKAYALVTLQPARIAELVDRPHIVPSTGAEKPLLSMTFTQLMQILAAEGKRPDDEAAKLLKTFRRQARALLRTLDTLSQARDAVDGDDLGDLYDKLQDALARLADSYDLEQD